MELKKIYESRFFLFFLDVVFIALAVGLSIYARYYFVDMSAAHNQIYFFDNNRILTTNDAYHYATAIKDIINGHIDDAFYGVASKEFFAQFGAFLVRILPFSLDSLMFIAPIILGSLLAIPVFLIAKEFMNRYFALFVALLAPLTQSYVNRTIAGYFDTDMLVLVLPLFGIYFLILLLKNNNFTNLIFALIFFTLSLAWHKVSATYLLPFSIFCAIIYAIKFKRDEKLFQSFGLLIISLAHFNIIIKLILLLILLHFCIDKPLMLRNLTQNIKYKIRYFSLLIFTIGIAIFLVANADLLISRFQSYITHDLNATKIAFKSVADTIMELSPLSFDAFIKRVIGDLASFCVACAGILLLFFKHPRSIVLLPFVILGLLSMKIGLRFAMFGAPVFVLGFFYFVWFVAQWVANLFVDKPVKWGAKAAILLAAGYVSILPNYYYVKNLLVDPVVDGYEIPGLFAINRISQNRDNITISWWDYGFLIPYYSNTRPIVTGLDMAGEHQFIASFILSNPSQRASYNLAHIVANAINDKKNIIDIFGDSPNDFIANLNNAKVARFPNEIYFYLPVSMLRIQTAISAFSNIDLNNGAPLDNDKRTLAEYEIKSQNDSIYELILISNRIQKTNDESYTPINNAKDEQKLEFNAKTGILIDKATNERAQVQKFHIIERENNDENKIDLSNKHSNLKTTTKIYSSDKNKLHVIYSKDTASIFVIDEKTNASLAVQLFLYENYDKDLFSPIFRSSLAKTYKLK